MILRLVLWAVVVAFPISEIALAFARRARSRIAHSADQGSLGFLWWVIAGSLTTAIVAQWAPIGRIPVAPWLLRSLALLLLVFGLGLRWVAVVSLGRFFTVDVAIHENHLLVDRGVYRYVRHPSYAGLLIAFVGLGVVFGNWLSLSALPLPIGAAIMIRIRKEEKALLEGLGASYAEYCGRTKRLIPGVF